MKMANDYALFKIEPLHNASRKITGGSSILLSIKQHMQPRMMRHKMTSAYICRDQGHVHVGHPNHGF